MTGRVGAVPPTHSGGDLSQHNILCYSPPLSSILDGLLGLLLLLPLEPVHVGFEQVAVGQLEPDSGVPYNTFIGEERRGSVSNPDWIQIQSGQRIRIPNPDPDPGEQKRPTKILFVGLG
jgi:hypothetical protein